jgi:hypothetical protein
MEDVGIFIAIWYILPLIGKFYCHLVNFLVIWYIFSRIGMLYQEKSGNPARHFSVTEKRNQLTNKIIVFMLQ